MQSILYITLLVCKYREQEIIKYDGNHEQRYEEYGLIIDGLINYRYSTYVSKRLIK